MHCARAVSLAVGARDDTALAAGLADAVLLLLPWRLTLEEKLIELEELLEGAVTCTVFVRGTSVRKYAKAGVMLDRETANPAVAASTVRIFMVHRGKGKRLKRYCNL